ncbi:MAG: TlpA family protein disulfide reductase [Nitrococcus sp.]|nr:TlpA family protein disulfide reductase [Nitrococcus sp.]
MTIIQPSDLALKGAIWLFALGIGSALGASAPLPFKAGSLPNILDAHAGEPFLLVLWSLRCLPCREEMDLLADMRRQHPDLEVVFISTDGVNRRDMVAGALAQHGLENAESWIFAGPVQRLRYAIDPAWYGVLPRSYFYDANHERVAVNGSLEKAQILAWLDYLDSRSAPPESE